MKIDWCNEISQNQCQNVIVLQKNFKPSWNVPDSSKSKPPPGVVWEEFCSITNGHSIERFPFDIGANNH